MGTPKGNVLVEITGENKAMDKLVLGVIYCSIVKVTTIGMT